MKEMQKSKANELLLAIEIELVARRDNRAEKKKKKDSDKKNRLEEKCYFT